MDFTEEIPGFLIESSENLAQLDREMVELEKNPGDEALIASVFRTIHTLKGTSGFFGFDLLGSMTHIAENILGQVREKQRVMTPELVSLILRTVDAVRMVLASVEATGVEGPDQYAALRLDLETAFRVEDAASDLEPADLKPIDLKAAKTSDKAQQQLVVGSEKGEEATVIATPPPAHEFTPAVNPGRRSEDNASNSTIRVDVSLLDKLMNLVGELVLTRNQILQGSVLNTASHAPAQRLNLITSELQEGVMRTRMQPISSLWNKLPRVVRDLASELGKKIELRMEGAETELDKTIIEAIKDPLTHIVRKSCDHGVEGTETRLAKGKNPAGTITLRAFHEGGHVNIEIADDGAGIDPEKVKNKAVQKGLIRPEQAAQLSEWEALRLIFLPGFSTAEKVTGISGRGVGMDVVKTNIEKISGTVDMANLPGGGTMIKIKIPLTLAIIPGLIVSVRSTGTPEDSAAQQAARTQRFVIPQANLLELVRIEGEKGQTQIESVQGVEVYRRRGELLPLVSLSTVLGLKTEASIGRARNIVVLKAEDTSFGLIVDDVNDTQEIVVKALGKQLNCLTCYVGATIMGDGKIALILDVAGIARLANLLAHRAERTLSTPGTASTANATRQMLLFRCGRYSRLALDLSLVARLEEIPRIRLEFAVGKPVVRYRNAILPLISLSHLLDPGMPSSEMDAESLQVIVFSDGNRFVGLVVEAIVDIIEDAVESRQPSSAFGLLGSAVVDGKVTDFVDLDAILEGAKMHPSIDFSSARPQGKNILLVHPNRTVRGVLRSFLEMHGHRVTDREHSGGEMLAGVEVVPEVILYADEDPAAAATDHSDRDLLSQLQKDRTLAAVPRIALTRRGGGSATRSLPHADASREDRARLLQLIESAVIHYAAPTEMQDELIEAEAHYA